MKTIANLEIETVFLSSYTPFDLMMSTVVVSDVPATLEVIVECIVPIR